MKICNKILPQYLLTIVVLLQFLIRNERKYSKSMAIKHLFDPIVSFSPIQTSSCLFFFAPTERQQLNLPWKQV